MKSSVSPNSIPIGIELEICADESFFHLGESQLPPVYLL